MKFYIGLHQPSDAKNFAECCISVNRLRARKKFIVHRWIMDSGAFTELSIHGRYRQDAREYAEEVCRWKSTGNLQWAATQDYMCEPFILEKTGLSVQEHQYLTIERYLSLRDKLGALILPVLQGFHPEEYANHVRQYACLLGFGALVGVGSVCKRQGNPSAILSVLAAILNERPDLRLHGFGLKVTALHWASIRDRLYSADSMAWSYSARKQGLNANDWRNAAKFTRKIEKMPVQTSFL